MCAEKRNENRKRVSNQIAIAFSTARLNATPLILQQNRCLILILKSLKPFLLPENLNSGLSDGSAGKVLFALRRHNKYTCMTFRANEHSEFDTSPTRNFPEKMVHFQKTLGLQGSSLSLPRNDIINSALAAVFFPSHGHFANVTH